MAAIQRNPRDILLDTDADYQRLFEQHEKYDSELRRILNEPYLSSEDLLEEIKLKKMKLHCKDEMERIAFAYPTIARATRLNCSARLLADNLRSPLGTARGSVHCVCARHAATDRLAASSCAERCGIFTTAWSRKDIISVFRRCCSAASPSCFIGGFLAALLVALALFCFSFFRDPEREISSDPAAIVSPADGRVVVITDEENAGRPGTRISIFLAIWNVHVNRSPAAGVISKIDYRPGKFLAAWDPNASTQNEQNIFTLGHSAGEESSSSRSPAWLLVAWSPGRSRRTASPKVNASALCVSARASICGFHKAPSFW